MQFIGEAQGVNADVIKVFHFVLSRIFAEYIISFFIKYFYYFPQSNIVAQSNIIANSFAENARTSFYEMVEKYVIFPSGLIILAN